jgi:hypothetical protein
MLLQLLEQLIAREWTGEFGEWVRSRTLIHCSKSLFTAIIAHLCRASWLSQSGIPRILAWIHVEVQSQHEQGFPKRMFVYHYRIFDDYDHEVIGLAVLADERPHTGKDLARVW